MTARSFMPMGRSRKLEFAIFPVRDLGGGIGEVSACHVVSA